MFLFFLCFLFRFRCARHLHANIKRFNQSCLSVTRQLVITLGIMLFTATPRPGTLTILNVLCKNVITMDLISLNSRSNIYGDSR